IVTCWSLSSRIVGPSKGPFAPIVLVVWPGKNSTVPCCRSRSITCPEMSGGIARGSCAWETGTMVPIESKMRMLWRMRGWLMKAKVDGDRGRKSDDHHVGMDCDPSYLSSFMRTAFFVPHPALQEFIQCIMVIHAQVATGDAPVICPYPPAPQD